MSPASLSLLLASLASGPGWPGGHAVEAREAAALPDGAARLRAIERLAVRAGAGARPLLLPFLKDTEAGVRLFAARWLVRAGEPAAVEAAVSWIMTPLVAQIDRRLGLDILRDAPTWTPAARHAVERAVRDGDASVRSAALDALERHDAGSSLSSVLAALEDDSREVRLRAIRLAGQSRDGRATLPLLGRMEDSDRLVRVEAARALGTQPSARPALLRLASDGAEDVRLAAVDALAQLRAPDAVPLLVSLARRRPADELARRAQLALGAVATPDAVATLLSLARTPPVADEVRTAVRRAGLDALPALMREVDAGTLTSAALAMVVLADLGDRRAVAPLMAAVDRGGDLAPLALDGLAALGDRTALVAVVRASESGDVAVRRRAFAALVKLRDARAIVAVDRGLGDPDPRVRELTAKLSEVLDVQAAGPGLVALLGDKDGAVRMAAASALSGMGAPSRGAVAAIVAIVARSAPAARDEASWAALAAAVERVADADDVERLSVALRGAHGIGRLPWVRGLAGAGTSKPLAGRAVIDQLLAALPEGDAVALAAADALAVANLPDDARVALARAFEAAEPPLRVRLCPAIARMPRGGDWLAAILRSRREPAAVRAAAAWAARSVRESGDLRGALAEAVRADGAGPVASNARAARAASPANAHARWTEIRVRAPDGSADAGRWVSVSAPEGVSVWTTTDASGAARLRDVPAGPLTLRVEAALLRRDAP